MASLDNIANAITDWEATNAIIEKRSTLFKDITVAARDASAKCQMLQEKCDRLDLENSNLHTQLRGSVNTQVELQAQLDLKSFVVVLIDGDNTNFLDRYVTSGARGGREAAVDLHRSLTKGLTTNGKYTVGWDIMVRIYVNMDGLAEAYRKSGAIPDQATFRAFIKAFNKERVFSEFIDAGDDKEAADGKIQENFRLMWHLPQCKYILLGGSGDRGYARFLREYTQTEGHRSRIVLLKSRPFAREFAEVASRVTIVEAPDLFRDSPLQEAAVTLPPAVVRQDSALSTYAGAIAATPNVSLPSVASTAVATTAPAARVPPTGTMRFNSAGHRLDVPVRYDKQMKDLFKGMDRRPCFDHYLSDCWRTACEYEHDLRLDRIGRDTLLYVARLQPCRDAYCENASCYFGHRCPYGQRCEGRCGFREEMHNVDTNVATRTTGTLSNEL